MRGLARGNGLTRAPQATGFRAVVVRYDYWNVYRLHFFSSLELFGLREVIVGLFHLAGLRNGDGPGRSSAGRAAALPRTGARADCSSALGVGGPALPAEATAAGSSPSGT